MSGSNVRLAGPEDALDKRIVLMINSRERMALAIVSRSMGLSPTETLRSLIMTATLELKPKKERY